MHIILIVLAASGRSTSKLVQLRHISRSAHAHRIACVFYIRLQRMLVLTNSNKHTKRFQQLETVRIQRRLGNPIKP